MKQLNMKGTKPKRWKILLHHRTLLMVYFMRYVISLKLPGKKFYIFCSSQDLTVETTLEIFFRDNNVQR